MDKLRFANEREEAARHFIELTAVTGTNRSVNDGGYISMRGNVADKGKNFTPSLTIDKDERIVKADCTCNWHQQNKLFKGPCEHILALRMKESR